MDHLNTPPIADSERKVHTADQRRWNDETNKLFIALLYKISLALDYAFDEVLLNKGFYAPRGHDDLENDQWLARKGLLAVLLGSRSIPVELRSPSDTEASDQQRIRELTIKYLEGKIPMPVKVVQQEKP